MKSTTSQYMNGVIQKLEHSGTPITAQEARGIANQSKASANINYSLTIRRVYALIRSACKKNDSELKLRVPSYVPGGTVCDPILLAQQLRAKLSGPDHNYTVSREDDLLTISW